MCFMSYRNDIIKFKPHIWRGKEQQKEEVFNVHFLIILLGNNIYF